MLAWMLAVDVCVHLGLSSLPVGVQHTGHIPAVLPRLTSTALLLLPPGGRESM